MSEAVHRIDAAAAEPHAVEHLSTYFHEPGQHRQQCCCGHFRG
jgi:hypothetical protein